MFSDDHLVTITIPVQLGQPVANAGRVESVTKDGRNYYVCDVVMAKEMVMNGSAGPVLYRKEMWQKKPQVWNDLPIVLRHPKRDGQFISARDPGVLESHELGRIYNVRWDTDKLKATAYFDKAKINSLWPELAIDLEAGNPIEVSTGLALNAKEAEAGSVFEGRQYTYEAIDYVADHLAVLPDEKGACSVKDGCGVHNTDKSQANEEVIKAHKTFIKSESIWGRLCRALGLVSNAAVSHDNIRDMLASQIKERFEQSTIAGEYHYCYVVDVYDKYVVYYRDEKLWKISYSTDSRSGKVALSDDKPVEVSRLVSYKEVANAQDAPATDTVLVTEDVTKLQSDKPDITLNNSEIDVNKTQLIDWLVGNCSCWKGEKDREVLNALPEEKLKTLKDSAEKQIEMGKQLETIKAMNAATTVQQPVPVAQPVQPVQAQPAPATMTSDQWMALAPKDIRDALELQVNREKNFIIQQITANTAQDKKLEMVTKLQAKTIDELRELQTLVVGNAQARPQDQYAGLHPMAAMFGLAPGAIQMPGVANYLGASAPVVNAEDDEEVLELPTFNTGLQPAKS